MTDALTDLDDLTRRVLECVRGPLRCEPSVNARDGRHLWVVSYTRRIYAGAGETTELAEDRVSAYGLGEALAFVLARETERDMALLKHLSRTQQQENDHA